MKISNKKIAGSDYFSEESQQVRCKFQLCNTDGENIYPLHHPVLCRDFLGDYLGWNKGFVIGIGENEALENICPGYDRGPGGIYHFDADNYKELDTSACRLIISRCPNPLETQLDKVHEILDAGFPESIIRVDKFSKSKYYVELEPYWISNTVRLAFATFVLRAAVDSPEYPFGERAGAWGELNKAENKVEYLQELSLALSFLPDKGPIGASVEACTNRHSYHDNNGIVSALTKKWNVYHGDLKNALSSLR